MNKISLEDLIFLSKKIDSSVPRINQWMKNKKTYLSHKRIKNKKYLKLEQKQTLMNFYNNNTFWPSKIDIKSLASQTYLSEQKIRRWFSNKRFEDKNLNKSIL